MQANSHRKRKTIREAFYHYRIRLVLFTWAGVYVAILRTALRATRWLQFALIGGACRVADLADAIGDQRLLYDLGLRDWKGKQKSLEHL